VTVTTGTTALTSNQTFKVKPTLKTFTPVSGPVGTLVTITGTGLKQASKVTFNGTSASFTVKSDTQITATVPAGATTGKVVVFTKGGSVLSATSFTVN
jgi:large repetitive protein